MQGLPDILCSGWSVQIHLDVSLSLYGIYFSLLFVFLMVVLFLFFLWSVRDFSLVVQLMANT